MRWNIKKNFENDKCSAKDQHQSSESVLPRCALWDLDLPLEGSDTRIVLVVVSPPPLLKVKCLPTFLFNRKKKKIWVNFLFFFLLLQRQPLLWLNTLDLGCCLLGGQSQCTENIFSPFTRKLVSWFSEFFSLAGRGLSLFGVYPYT